MGHDAAAGAVAVARVGPTGPVALEECTLAYGRDLLAYLLGAGAGKPLATWRLEAASTTEGAWDRLRACYHVLRVFKEPRLAKAWMRRAAPRLGGHTPAWAVRTGDPALLAAVEQEADRHLRRPRGAAGQEPSRRSRKSR
ncbi:MAG TPA: hypothetical protein VGP31_12955 [Planosporangium sp.]|jgi:hypothetical protein|nr:hypothetical protein [Planosporangium sp.]